MPERRGTFSLHRQFYDQIARRVEEMIEAHGESLCSTCAASTIGEHAMRSQMIRNSAPISIWGYYIRQGYLRGLLDRFGDACARVR